MQLRRIAGIEYGYSVESRKCDIESFVIARKHFRTRLRAVGRVKALGAEETKVQTRNDAWFTLGRDLSNATRVGERSVRVAPAAPRDNRVGARAADILDPVGNWVHRHVHWIGLRIESAGRLK